MRKEKRKEMKKTDEEEKCCDYSTTEKDVMAMIFTDGQEVEGENIVEDHVMGGIVEEQENKRNMFGEERKK